MKFLYFLFNSLGTIITIFLLYRPWLIEESKKLSKDWNIMAIIAKPNSRVHNHPNATQNGIDLFGSFYAARQC